MTDQLNWERDPVLDSLKAKTGIGTYKCIRTCFDQSVLYFEDDELARNGGGSHAVSKGQAEIHYKLTKEKDTMHTYILIDRSGSMATNWIETIGAVNGYVKALSKNKETKKAKVTVAAFDTVFDTGGGRGGVIDFVELRRNITPTKWVKVETDEITPRGMTPLFDAIGKIVSLVEDDNPKLASIAIITDGAENSSKEVSKLDAKASLERLREKGFDIVFLGADFDAFGEAASVGTTFGQTLNMTKGNYVAAMDSLASKTRSYAETGNVSSWSDADRATASK